MKRNFRKISLALLLSVLIPFEAGCAKTNTAQSAPKDNISKEIEDDSVAEIKEEVEDSLSEREVISYFKEYQPQYYFEESLITPAKVDEIIEKSTKDTECTFEFDGNIDNIIETIQNNSNTYILEHPEYSSAFTTDILKIDEYSDQIDFEISLKNVFEELIEKGNNNIYEDFHRMQDLKIVFGNCQEEEKTNERILLYDEFESLVLGSYDVIDNVIVLDKEAIKIDMEMYDESFLEALYKTLLHEINHVRQQKCPCRITEELNQTDLSYDEYPTFIMESSAESEIYNLDKEIFSYGKDSFDYTYHELREYESLLLLLALFDTDKNIDEFYKAIFDTDLEALLTFFNVEEKDTYTFYKLWYIIDSLDFRTDLSNSMYSESEYGNITLGEYQEDIGYAYRTQIFAMSLARLSEYTVNNEDFTLIDNLLMFNIIKNKIAANAYIYEEIGDEIVKKYDPVFVDEVFGLEQKYREFLIYHYDVNLDEITDLEYYEVNTYGDTLMGLVNSSWEYDESYLEKSEELLKRFPLLKATVFPDVYFIDYFNEMKENNSALVLTK